MEEKYNCGMGACPGVYEVRSNCVVGECPAVYEVRTADCIGGACPSVHTSEDKYYVIGRQLSKQEIEGMGLEKKVGEGETLIEVPKDLLKNL